MTRYNIVLDLYPLLTTFPSEAGLLVLRIEEVMFDYLKNPKKILELELLLKIAYDLGYLDKRVYYFLKKKMIITCQDNR